MNETDYLKLVADLQGKRAEVLIGIISAGLSFLPWVIASSYHMLHEDGIGSLVVAILSPVIFIFANVKIGKWYASIPEKLGRPQEE